MALLEIELSTSVNFPFLHRLSPDVVASDVESHASYDDGSPTDLEYLGFKDGCLVKPVLD